VAKTYSCFKGILLKYLFRHFTLTPWSGDSERESKSDALTYATQSGEERKENESIN